MSAAVACFFQEEQAKPSSTVKVERGGGEEALQV